MEHQDMEHQDHESEERNDLPEIPQPEEQPPVVQEEHFKQRIDLSQLANAHKQIQEALRQYIVGQDKVIDMLLIALFADGHVLLEGVPGVAKTLMSKLLAKSISADFSRLQFTPDLMPSDVVGTSVYNQQQGAFEFKSGPVFSNFVLVDEVNRAPAKTQAALIEVMEERQVTVDGVSHTMDAPFLVLATQNPVEQEGTYRLPEAQLDRFLFKLNVGYPNAEQERQILINTQQKGQRIDFDALPTVLSKADILENRKRVEEVHVEEKLLGYMAEVVHQTRNHHAIYLGASPRASLSLLRSSKAAAALRGRDFVTPDDIKLVAEAVLNHRIVLTPEKEMEGISPGDVIAQIMETVEIPR